MADLLNKVSLASDHEEYLRIKCIVIVYIIHQKNTNPAKPFCLWSTLTNDHDQVCMTMYLYQREDKPLSQ